MTHFTLEKWTKYVRNELELDEREKAENHLYLCDECLELYLQAVAENDASLPDSSQMESMTDKVMEEIQKLKPVEKQKIMRSPSPFYQKTIFHYTVAAVATLVLMMTGVFQNLTEYTGAVQSSSQQEKKSVTEGIVTKTFDWLDAFEANFKEGKDK